jgi:hypothetical protein
MKIAVGHVGPRQWAMTVIVTTIGAVSTTLLGVLAGSILSSRSQKRQWSRDRQADACAQVLRESSNILIEFNRLTRQPVEPVADGATVPTPMDWKPWNEALAMIVLVADHEIVEAAQAIDAQIWPVHQQIKRGWIPAGGWLKLRDAIEARRERFVNVARKRRPRRVHLCAGLRADPLLTIHSGNFAGLISRPTVPARDPPQLR